VFQSAHPKWLLEKLDSAWPKASVEEIIIGNNTQAPMTLRINQKQYSREKYLRLLNNAGIAAESSSLNESGIKLDSAVDVGNLPGFESGACSVQDEAAQLAAGLLELRPRQTVLDACCAPGGKTCHILESEPDLQSLLAIDSETQRLRKVADNLSRLDLQAQLLAAKAENPEDWWNGNHFDRILLDAPCSATGVIRRHPDIKILRKPTDIDKLIKIQLSLLEGLWKTLANEGILVYATCSILPEENDEVIKAFIESQQYVAIMEIKECWGQKTEYGRQLFPTVSGHDGFYYARLKKLG
jgi:16S rRNA (cytosine967-C5)-methyltransferase